VPDAQGDGQDLFRLRFQISNVKDTGEGQVRRGALGKVLVGLRRHRKTGFIGALKIMRKSIIQENSYDKRERIIRQITSEIKLQWFLNHPNLVKLYDFFDDRHNIYLFVELGSDGHLFDLMEKKGTFSE
jgi:serine/threonine protein kinase